MAKNALLRRSIQRCGLLVIVLETTLVLTQRSRGDGSQAMARLHDLPGGPSDDASKASAEVACGCQLGRSNASLRSTRNSLTPWRSRSGHSPISSGFAFPISWYAAPTIASWSSRLKSRASRLSRPRNARAVSASLRLRPIYLRCREWRELPLPDKLHRSKSRFSRHWVLTWEPSARIGHARFCAGGTAQRKLSDSNTQECLTLRYHSCRYPG